MPPIDEKTTRLQLPKPAQPNTLKNDVQRLRDALDDIDEQMATLDPVTKKLDQSFVPDSVVTVDTTTGKINSGVTLTDVPVMTPDAAGQMKIPEQYIPDDAMTRVHQVASEVLMRDLKDAALGDVAYLPANDKYYMLVNKDPTQQTSWRELPPFAVTTKNSKTGATTAAEIDASGNNDDITSLTGLSKGGKPLSLGAPGVGPYDAVTVSQLANAGNAGGANMSGVMNNFVGAVEWFNGNRLSLPAGYVAADGQLESRTDPKTADLWTAIESGMFVSCSDTQWLNGPGGSIPKGQYRGMYSSGDGKTTFRVPDLNGGQVDSIRALFLRGDAAGQSSKTIGAVGEVLGSAAPNIRGTIALHGSQASDKPGGTVVSNVANGKGVVGEQPQMGYMSTTPTVNNINHSVGAVRIDASLSDPAYGRKNANGLDEANEIRPNSVNGIWIIRASGSFVSANSSFSILNADATPPSANRLIKTGILNPSYHVGGQERIRAEFYAEFPWGSNAQQATTNIGIAAFNDDGSVAANATFKFQSNGDFKTLGLVKGKSIQAFGDSPTQNIDPRTSGQGWYAGSLAAAFTVLFPDATSSCGLYVRSPDPAVAPYTHTLLARIDRGNYVWEIGGGNNGAIYKENGRTGSYGSLYGDAALKVQAADADGSSGNTQYQPCVAVMGGTSGKGYKSAVGFGKFTTSNSEFGYPCITRGLSDVAAGGGIASAVGWVFGNDGAGGAGIATNAGVIVAGGSDRRLKDDITDASAGAPERIGKLHTREFTWKGSKRRARGFIAQEAEEVDALYVHATPGKDGILNLEDRAIIADLVDTVKILMAKIEAQEQEIAALKA